MYERILLPHLCKAHKSLLLLGPRQVGKTTLLRQLEPDLILDMADLATHRDYVRRPELLAEVVRNRRNGSKRLVVLIDEIQKVPALLDQVQVAIDGDPEGVRFLVTGSSARKLRRGQANLLPGRVHFHYLHPLLACELGEEFDLERVMAHGTLPAVYAERNVIERARTLEAYANIYLREEVQAEALVRDLGAYARLLDLVAASAGQVINLHSLCKDAQVAYETARRYLQILEDTMLVFPVPAWSGSERASLIAHPRYFFFDNGVRNALLRRPLDRALDDDRGVLLEHVVAQEIHRRTHNLWYGPKLFHFRTRGDAEVDFVLEIERELWAIEVKASASITKVDTRGFQALEKRSNLVKRKIVVCTSKHSRRQDDVEILPILEFLAELPR